MQKILLMALEIRSIPVLTGEIAELFIAEAEENMQNPKKENPRFLSRAQFEKMERRRLQRMYGNQD